MPLGMTGELQQLVAGAGGEPLELGAVLEDAHGLARRFFAILGERGAQCGIVHAVHRRHGFRRGGEDAENPGAVLIDARFLMALARVRPIGNEERAVGRGDDGDPAEPGIARHDGIPDTAGNIGAAVGVEAVLVHAFAMDIAHQSVAAHRFGPGAAIANKESAMRVAAAVLAVHLR